MSNRVIGFYIRDHFFRDYFNSVYRNVYIDWDFCQCPDEQFFESRSVAFRRSQSIRF